MRATIELGRVPPMNSGTKPNHSPGVMTWMVGESGVDSEVVSKALPWAMPVIVPPVSPACWMPVPAGT